MHKMEKLNAVKRSYASVKGLKGDNPVKTEYQACTNTIRHNESA